MSRDVKVNILGDSRDFSRAVGSARRDADGLGGVFSRVTSSMGSFAFGGIAALGGLTVAGGFAAMSFVRAAEESQQVTRQTNAVLESMGAQSWITAGQVEALATSLSNMSGVDDELIQSGQNVLLTFGNVQNRVGAGRNIFDRATEAALNMSAALGTDMTQASMQIGRALNDPIRGLAALRRSGVQFTEQQEDQIRAMVEAGDVTGAQVVMLQELDRQFGGSAEAQATATQRISTMWGNLQEQIGAYLLPAFEAFADWLAEHLPGILETAGGWFETFAGKIRSVVDFVQANWPIIKMKISEILDEISERFKTFWGYVEGGWATFGTNIQTSSSSTFSGLLENAKGSLEMFRGIAQTVMGLFQGDWDKTWAGITRTFSGAWRGMLGFLTAQQSFFLGAGSAIASAIGRGFTGALRAVWDGFANWWDSISITVPEVNIPGIGSFGGWTFDPAPAPRFHSGGIYRAPNGMREGLALLSDGERVQTPAQQAADQGGMVHVQVIVDGNVLASALERRSRRGEVLQVRVA